MRKLKEKDGWSRELDSSFINEDGVKRNLLKFYWEWVWCWRSTVEARKRLFSNWRIDHNLMNLVVENFRCSPYLWGHVVLLGLAAGIIIQLVS
jgi:hypothetical protein